MSEHKHKKEKTLPLEVHDKVQEDFVVVREKHFTKHGGQAIKQVLKPKIFSNALPHRNLSFGKNHNTMVLDHTFFI
jgi:hypothetical protein